MDLTALRDFHAVAAHGSFSMASRRSGTAKATLSRRVRALEADVRVRLFDRGTRALRLTAEGRALHERTRAPLAEILEAADELRGRAGRPQGRLRVSAPVLLASQALGRIAAEFVAAHPEVELEIVAEDRMVDPVNDGYDVVIRANPASTSNLVGHRLSRDDVVVAAHPSVRRPPASAADAEVPAVLLTASPANERWALRAPDGRRFSVRPRARLRLSSLSLVHQAALAGAGAASFSRALVAADVAAGRLTLWGQWVGRRAEAWALYPARRWQPAKLTAFVQFLRGAFPDRHR